MVSTSSEEGEYARLGDRVPSRRAPKPIQSHTTEGIYAHLNLVQRSQESITLRAPPITAPQLTAASHLATPVSPQPHTDQRFRVSTNENIKLLQKLAAHVTKDVNAADQSPNRVQGSGRKFKYSLGTQPQNGRNRSDSDPKASPKSSPKGKPKQAHNLSVLRTLADPAPSHMPDEYVEEEFDLADAGDDTEYGSTPTTGSVNSNDGLPPRLMSSPLRNAIKPTEMTTPTKQLPLVAHKPSPLKSPAPGHPSTPRAGDAKGGLSHLSEPSRSRTGSTAAGRERVLSIAAAQKRLGWNTSNSQPV
jgi:hypothetical protein